MLSDGLVVFARRIARRLAAAPRRRLPDGAHGRGEPPGHQGPQGRLHHRLPRGQGERLGEVPRAQRQAAQRAQREAEGLGERRPGAERRRPRRRPQGDHDRPGGRALLLLARPEPGVLGGPQAAREGLRDGLRPADRRRAPTTSTSARATERGSSGATGPGRRSPTPSSRTSRATRASEARSSRRWRGSSTSTRSGWAGSRGSSPTG